MVKLKIIIFILLLNYVHAQNYEKDWNALNKKIEAGAEISVKEAEAFASKHKNKLAANADNSTQLYSILAGGYYDLSQFDKAEQAYLESYSYARLAKDTSLKHIVELSLAVLYYNTSNLIKAEKYYLACMYGMAAIYGQSSREYTQIFYDYTRLLIDLGKYTDAQPYVEALLYYYKTLDGENSIHYAGLLTNKAIILQNLGKYEEALTIYSAIVNEERALKLGDTLGQVICILNLGDLYRETGEFESALHHLLLAKQKYHAYKLKNKETLAIIENNLALCYKSMANLQLAEEAYNNALRIYHDGNKTTTEFYCSVLSNKADLLRNLGRYYEASELLLTAIDIRKQLFGENTENYANALSNLGNVYFDAGYDTLALEKFLQAKEIYLAVVGEDHQGYANCLNNLSLCYLHTQEYQKAEEMKLSALRIIEKSVGKDHYRYPAFLISTYGLYKKTNQLDKAESNMKEVLTLVERNFGRKHDLFANAQLALAEIYTLKERYEEAGPLYFECLAYYAAQINAYFNAMSEADQMSFLALTSAAFESYNIYVINYKLHFLGKELPEHVRLTLKYQLLLKSLLANKSAKVRKEVAASKDEQLKAIYAEWLALKNELIDKYKSTNAASDDNSELLKRTSELETQLRSKVSSFIKEDDVSFEQLKDKLAPNEAAIEVFKTRESLNDSQAVTRYAALIIKKNSKDPELVIFSNGDAMEAQGFTYYSNCIDEQKLDTLSYGLYFKAFEGRLHGVNRLYVSSDGVFHKLSWASLYNPQKKKYLVEDMEIYQTSNLGSFSTSSSKTIPGQLQASLFGYPDYDYDFKINKAKSNAKADQLLAKRFGLVNLVKLPGTKTEVEEISKELRSRSWTVEAYTEEFASEEALRKIRSPKVLHIATHGFYLKDVESEDKLFLGFENSMIRNNSLLRSGIILAGAGPATQDSTNQNSENDGIVTAYEACLLDLNQTELVVLSACQTGLGDEMGSEGVAGLQRSLAIAGAKNIVMSLWPVDDFATQHLMTTFYKSYAVTQNVEQAFKIAQLDVKKKYPQPMFWAAFVLLKTFN